MIETTISLERRHADEGPDYFVQGNQVTESDFLLLIGVLRVGVDEFKAGGITVTLRRSIRYGAADPFTSGSLSL